MSKKAIRKIYVAIKYVPREEPILDWTKSGIAEKVSVHRNSIVFNEDGVACVKGWLIYEKSIDTTVPSLRRSNNIVGRE